MCSALNKVSNTIPSTRQIEGRHSACLLVCKVRQIYGQDSAPFGTLLKITRPFVVCVMVVEVKDEVGE